MELDLNTIFMGRLSPPAVQINFTEEDVEKQYAISQYIVFLEKWQLRMKIREKIQQLFYLHEF